MYSICCFVPFNIFAILIFPPVIYAVIVPDNLFVSNKLAPIEQIISTATHFVLKKYKDHGTVLVSESEDERMIVTP